MAEFSELRKELNESRKNTQASKRALFLARERLKKAQNELKDKQRSVHPSDPSGAARLNELYEKIDREKETIASLDDQYKKQIETEAAIYERFAPFADPRERISSLSDHYPILLFPVRLVT